MGGCYTAQLLICLIELLVEKVVVLIFKVEIVYACTPVQSFTVFGLLHTVQTYTDTVFPGKLIRIERYGYVAPRTAINLIRVCDVLFLTVDYDRRALLLFALRVDKVATLIICAVFFFVPVS